MIEPKTSCKFIWILIYLFLKLKRLFIEWDFSRPTGYHPNFTRMMNQVLWLDDEGLISWGWWIRCFRLISSARWWRRGKLIFFCWSKDDESSASAWLRRMMIFCVVPKEHKYYRFSLFLESNLPDSFQFAYFFLKFLGTATYYRLFFFLLL